MIPLIIVWGLVSPILTETSLTYSQVALQSRVGAETTQPSLLPRCGDWRREWMLGPTQAWVFTPGTGPRMVSTLQKSFAMK